MAQKTVVFADLTGSTSVFEALGNKLATQAVTALTQWIAGICASHEGTVVKTLGDGVLATFACGARAIDAVVQMQREHAARIQEWANPLRMRLQVGLAAGEVIELDGDCYGDAVNVASRLSDLSGADQIWATESVIAQCQAAPEGVRFRNLGPVAIRGKNLKLRLFQVDWREDVHTMQLTQPGHLMQPTALGALPMAQSLSLSWLDQQLRFALDDMPVQLGRDEQVQFPVPDQRVSRVHARIDWRNGHYLLTDMSSYGTWVRFDGGGAVLALRRSDCVLVGGGEIALGASFEDFTVPTVRFDITG